MRSLLAASIRAAIFGLFFIAGSATASLGAQEVIIGGEAVVLPSVTFSPRSWERIVPLFRTEFRAITGVYADRAELNATVSVWHEMPDSASANLESGGVALDELKLSFAPAPWASIQAGKFSHPTGRALLLSPNNPFVNTSLDAILRGDLDTNGGSQTIAVGTVFFGRASLALVGMPAPAVPQLIEPGSIWIPWLPIDEVIDDPRIAPEPVTLGEVYAERTRVTEEQYRRVSGGAHADMFFGPVDISLLYYHGVDPSPVPRVRIDFPRAPVDAYDLYLAPEEAIIDSFGLVAEGVLGSGTFWLDAAYVPNKTIATTIISPYSKRARLVSARTMTAVAGASYAADRSDLILIGEYYFSHSFLPDDISSDSVVMPPLSNDLLASVLLRAGAASPWGLVLAGIASFDDSSGVISLSLSYEPTRALAAAVRVPLFIGSTNSAFGQYSDIVPLISEIRLRY